MRFIWIPNNRVTLCMEASTDITLCSNSSISIQKFKNLIIRLTITNIWIIILSIQVPTVFGKKKKKKK